VPVTSLAVLFQERLRQGWFAMGGMFCRRFPQFCPACDYSRLGSDKFRYQGLFRWSRRGIWQGFCVCFAGL